MMNWGINLFISYFTPHIIDAIGEENIGYIFLFFSVMSIIGLLFIVFFMKETKGKTVQQIEDMFNMDQDHRELIKVREEQRESGANIG
jgi:Na+/melibiose symporter-like transporter